MKLLYLAVIAFLVLVCLVFKYYAAFTVIIILLAVAAFSGLYLMLSAFGLKCTGIKSGLSTERGQPLHLSVQMRNRGLPVFKAELCIVCVNMYSHTKMKSFAVFDIGAGREKDVRFDIISGHCGSVGVPVRYVRIYDPLSLFSIKRRIAAEASVPVMPKTAEMQYDIPPVFAEVSDSDVFSAERPGGDPSEIFGFRDYRPGDAMKNIHWKLSTKQDGLIVKEYSLPINSSCCIIVELWTEKRMDYSKIDNMLDAAASLSYHMLESGIRHVIYCYDSVKRELLGCVVSDEEGIYEALWHILSSGTYNGRPALASFKEQGLAEKYGRIYYFTAEDASDEAIENMKVIRCIEDLTA